MPRLKAGWQASQVLSFKLFQVEFLTTLSGDALITLCYHRPWTMPGRPRPRRSPPTWA